MFYRTRKKPNTHYNMTSRIKIFIFVAHIAPGVAHYYKIVLKTNLRLKYNKSQSIRRNVSKFINKQVQRPHDVKVPIWKSLCTVFF